MAPSAFRINHISLPIDKPIGTRTAAYSYFAAEK